MSYLALVPFCILFASFAIFRIELMYSAFLALLTSVVVTGGASSHALTDTMIFLFEIGLIVFGAFYFIEVAERKGVIHSLADLVREVTSNRIAQAILVCFPLGLMVEGSSGFGTPLLIIAPILRALGLPLILCAILPLTNMVCGIPFGALGTPIRLGFGQVENIVPIAHETIRHLSPLFWITPLLSYVLLRKKIDCTPEEKSPIWILWIILLSTTYGLVALIVSERNAEFPALAGALITFLVGIFYAHYLQHKKILFPHHRKGLMIYTGLLAALWLGKQIWMDQKFSGLPIRIFNPGWIFILFGLALSKSVEFVKPAAIRARKTLTVLFCMTFVIQQLKHGGAMQALLAAIPTWFVSEGTVLTSWLGSIMIGTSTMTNLFLSPLLTAPFYGTLSAASSLGVPMAFQAVIGVRSILKEGIPEREIFRYILPISISLMIVLFLSTRFLPS